MTYLIEYHICFVIMKEEWWGWGLYGDWGFPALHYWRQRVQKACESYVLPTRQVCTWAHEATVGQWLASPSFKSGSWRFNPCPSGCVALDKSVRHGIQKHMKHFPHVPFQESSLLSFRPWKLWWRKDIRKPRRKPKLLSWRHLQLV